MIPGKFNDAVSIAHVVYNFYEQLLKEVKFRNMWLWRLVSWVMRKGAHKLIQIQKNSNFFNDDTVKEIIK